jgi:hypothetical protein
MPLRVMLTGGPQSPSIDAVLELLGQDESLQRIDAQLKLFPECSRCQASCSTTSRRGAASSS